MAAIAPITGMLKRHALLNIGCGIGSGLAAGYYFWWGIRAKQIQKRDDYYLALQQAKA